MNTTIQLKTKHNNNKSVLYLANKKTDWKSLSFDKKEIDYINKKIAAKENLILVNQLTRLAYIQLIEEIDGKDESEQLETLRGIGNKVCTAINIHKYADVELQSLVENEELLLAIAEGCALSNYQFIKYKSEQDFNALKNIVVVSTQMKKTAVTELEILVEAVCKARNLVNEPQSHLNAIGFADEMKKMGKAASFRVEVLNKKQIEALKMGGLLAVNKGSQTPPTFTIMEYKPKKAINKKPIVLVGKGVVYDTGGLSLKPTAGMDTMKCDMAGGALVAATMYAVAKAQLKVHVIALVPATDNRPGENAYAATKYMSVWLNFHFGMIMANC